MRLAPLALALAACSSTDPTAESADTTPRLEVVAESTAQWTGVAVARDGRLFVNYPRWSDDVPTSVAEIVDGIPRPYPDATWNDWRDGADPARRFVCVQAVFADDSGSLWILDPASPKFGGVVAGGPKLVQVDLATDEIVRVYPFDAAVAPTRSYLNDVRVDGETRTAYMTDSEGAALVVLDLDTGAARRVLDGHPSTRAEDIELAIDGTTWSNAVHADGIALSPDRAWIYYQALTGRTLYRVPTAALRDTAFDDAALAAKVERVAESGASDGIVFGRDGRLYLSSLEFNAVRRLAKGGGVEVVVQDDRLAWPDSFAVGADGWIYVTTALIHRGDEPRDPYRVWRFRP